MMILMLHILYQKHHLDLPKCLVENLMFFTSNISYILNAAANIFKGCGIFDLIFLSNMLLLLFLFQFQFRNLDFLSGFYGACTIQGFYVAFHAGT